MFKKKLSELLSLSRITDDEFRFYFQWCALLSILGVIALFMSIMNIITHKQVLLIATATFSLVCFVNLFILLRQHRVNKVSMTIFQVAMILLFTYFILTGGTAGFSPLWILLLPACGMTFFGEKRGTIMSCIMMVIMIFFLWTPIGKSLLMYDYTPEFCMRFPVVYIAFFGVGAFFEKVRLSTHEEMTIAQNKITDIAEHDALTQIHNRFWFNKTFEAIYSKEINSSGHAMLLIDIDNFKQVNDTYGHDMGDKVLIEVAHGIREVLRKDDLLCRWGGEEFLIFLDCADENLLKMISDRIHTHIQEMQYKNEEIPEELNVTVSIGAVYINKGLDISSTDIFTMADDAAYSAKNQGKNQTVYYKAAERVAA